jgi:outer membrane protein OmpA-like peptidoglycan-associated protein
MAADHEGAGLASSLTDLMTSLAVIFILLLVAMLNNAREQAETTKSQVLKRLQDALKTFRSQGVQVETDPKDPLGLLVFVPEDLLRFQQGRSEIPPNGREFLAGFAPRLVSTACSAELREGISSIVVEGHASSEGSEKANLQLSQQRSMEVVKSSLSVLSSLPGSNTEASGLHGCFLEFVSATGRGSAEPVRNNAGQEDRERSRRVVFKIRVRSLEQRLFERQAIITIGNQSARDYYDNDRV